LKKLVCFTLGGQQFGVPIRSVKESVPFRPITRVFLVPPFVAGLINLRGEVVAVLDLARLLGLPHRVREGEAAIVILRGLPAAGARAQGHAAAGLLVDRLTGVRDVAEEAVRPPPPTLEADAASYLSGVATCDDPPRP
jgi:purine-binding chemotaxis protein CheW